MTNPQLPDSPIWFVRAEEKNVLADYFLENGLVSMGWGIGPVEPQDSQSEIIGRLIEYWPDRKQNILSKWAREIREFNQDIEIGETVATYEPRGRAYHIGTISALRIPPEQCHGILDLEYHDHVHRVDWRCSVSRDALPAGFARRHLDRRSTLHRLSDEASAVLRQHCSA